MKVICFGDSNTYGYDPRGYFGGRYEGDSRWVDILTAETGWTVCNMGQNGREIPSAAPAFPDDTDLLIVMLGTNDLLQGQSPEQAAERVEQFLAAVRLEGSKIIGVCDGRFHINFFVISRNGVYSVWIWILPIFHSSFLLKVRFILLTAAQERPQCPPCSVHG